MGYSLRSIFKGSLLYATGQVLTKASAFLLIPLYTRFLTPEDYGIVGYMQFMLSILTTILMFGFYGAQTRFFYQYKNDPEVVGQYLFSINIWLIGVLTPCVFLVVFFGQPVYRFVGPDDIPFSPYVPLIAWTAFFQIMNQLVISYWMARREYLKTTVLQMSLFLLVTGFAVLFVVGMKMGAEGKIRAMAFGNVVFFMLAYYPYARHFVYRIKWEYIAYSLSFGVPIVIHLLSGVMHTSIDRAILADMVPMAELGWYTLGYQVGMVMGIVTTSVNRAWQPSYYDIMESADPKNDHHICRTFNLWLILMSIICTAGMLWGGDILKLITPEHFHGATVVIPYVMLGYFFHGLYYFAVSPIFFYKKTILLPWFTGAAAAVNIGLNFLFIPHLGIIGAALATTISMFFQSVIVYLVGRKLHNHGFNLMATGFISLSMVFAFIGFLFVYDTFTSHALRVFNIIVLLTILYLFFKNDLNNFILSLNKRMHS
jgi:O-antigen/teichoic acid export membrane protein